MVMALFMGDTALSKQTDDGLPRRRNMALHGGVKFPKLIIEDEPLSPTGELHTYGHNSGGAKTAKPIQNLDRPSWCRVRAVYGVA
ncbi:hypothetical protein Trydic_g8604 [Trypoxylus dichotomus]